MTRTGRPSHGHDRSGSGCGGFDGRGPRTPRGPSGAAQSGASRSGCCSTLLAAAGAIHLVMVPVRTPRRGWPEGIGFRRWPGGSRSASRRPCCRRPSRLGDPRSPCISPAWPSSPRVGGVAGVAGRRSGRRPGSRTTRRRSSTSRASRSEVAPRWWPATSAWPARTGGRGWAAGPGRPLAVVPDRDPRGGDRRGGVARAAVGHGHGAGGEAAAGRSRGRWWRCAGRRRRGRTATPVAPTGPARLRSTTRACHKIMNGKGEGGGHTHRGCRPGRPGDAGSCSTPSSAQTSS